MSDRFVSGIILAAGRSSRLGRPKQLLDLGGQVVLAHVLDRARRAGLEELILVLGHEAGRIREAVEPHLDGVQVVVNPDYAAGQSTSLHAGLRAVSPASDAALILLGDQPRVGADVIGAVAAAFRSSGAPLVMPSYGGVPANPVLFARSLFPEMLAVTGDQGARDVVRARRAETILVPIPDQDPPSDLDTEADYQALVNAWTDRA